MAVWRILSAIAARRLFSSAIIETKPAVCSAPNTVDLSESISQASDIVDIGVLISCVILLMKSVFISESRFCLKRLNRMKKNETAMTATRNKLIISIPETSE
ncbi:hypothetical protein SDC9_105357 [bioreactor metagenome]|uniref:Uncharacterized protein n=1 Tax=bioreactor metagenome TaxID=1076179 RepID=A0A645B0F9_9ZZZZ